MVEEDMRSVNSQSTEHLVYSMTPREDTPYTPYEVDRLKRHLKFHFMTPCQKFKARKRKPWKLIVQILKIIIVTTQVFVFGMQRGNFVDFEQKTRLSLQHLLFKGWEPSYETMPYPAAIGRYALYKTTEIVDHLNYAMTNFNLTEKLAIGAYGFTEDQAGLRSKTATLTLVKFQVGEIFPNNVTYNLNPNLDKVSLTFNATKLENGTEVYDFQQVLRNNGQELSVNKLHSMELNFSLYGIHLKQGTNKVNVEPDCLLIKGKIKYDNSKHNGQMTVFMEIELVSKTCNDGSIFEEDTELETIALILLDSVVVLLCFLSTVTCARSMKRSVILYRKSRVFFKKHYGYKCTWDDVMVFANFWYVMIVTSDILCVIGTGLKVAISHQEYKYMEYSGMLLGIATVLVWMGVIRYFEYFERYNVLVLTCKKAFPDVIRFMICAATIYIAFTICGWLVLGPYHIKFQTIFASSECLFSLVNGDDMFVTFSVIDDKAPTAIWIFSRVYLYVFISLFIYFVLNVFISVIIDTYEVVKQHYIDGSPKTVVENFIDSCPDDPSSPLYISDMYSTRQCCSSAGCWLFFCGRRRDYTDDLTNILE